ncbi:MAG TPA: diacylglycerol kinase family protein, partial [Nitrospirae bacterium]|nr:diacylglycerol kinase family protein [Nitrospirota bacterium]HEW81292.1 diacylglycerol kinase family protein [Nitrospirota bacterium]
MPLRKWIKSANHAIEGILHAAKTQRHMRYHLYAAIIVLISAFLLGVGRIELVVLISLAILVISIEMINTSIEIITDILFKEYDPRA